MGTLEVGTAVRDITPGHPVWAHGYAARTRPSSGVKEPLSLGCLAVSDGDARVLIFTFDMVGVRSDVCEDLYGLIEKATGIGYPNILIAPSHTHFAPAMQGTSVRTPDVGFVVPDAGYVETVQARLVEAANEALSSLRPMRLETARIDSPQVVFNRRTVRKSDSMVQMNLLYPEDPTLYTFSPVDPELTVLRFSDESGIRAALLNFGCHPVTGSAPEEDYYRFSSDYPFYARETIEEAWHCPVYFTLGAAGDAVPINRKADCRERIGRVLGHSTVLAERIFREDTSGALSADSVDLEVETIIQTDPERAEVDYEAARKAVLNASDTKGEGYRELMATYTRKQLECARSRLYPENKARIQMQFVQIGKTVFVGLPFEVLAEIGLKMKAAFPDSVMVSCSGGAQGYLPLAHEYDRVGYEATESSTHFVPGTADRILQMILERLGK